MLVLLTGMEYDVMVQRQQEHRVGLFLTDAQL